MRNILKLLLISLICCAIPTALRAESKSPAIEFEQQQIDMGTLHAKNGKADFTFDFVNKGDAPLVIISATASCGCTQPKYPDAPLAPGQKGTISVSYNPMGKCGEVSSTITLRTNDKKHKKVVLRLKGTVVPE